MGRKLTVICTYVNCEHFQLPKSHSKHSQKITTQISQQIWNKKNFVKIVKNFLKKRNNGVINSSICLFGFCTKNVSNELFHETYEFIS